MKNIFTTFFRKTSIFFLLLMILSPIFLPAQNAADPDTTFNIGTGANFYIKSTGIQADGKIIIAGGFWAFNGVSKNYLARLNSDGTLDNTFNIGTGANQPVSAISIQSDGKIIIGGSFTIFNGVSKNCLTRLNVDGSIDTTFNIGTGPLNGGVETIGIQTDGKIIIGGFFWAFNGVSRNYLARLNSDGTLDNTFNIGTGFDANVNSIAIQEDSKIIIGGAFTTFNGVSKKHLARINADGSVDNTFNNGTGLDSDVYSIDIQKDFKIIIGGLFTSFNGISENRLLRLNAGGTLDTTFNIGTGFDANVSSIAIQEDSKIIIGGVFKSFNGVSINHLARLNTDGTLDNTFDIGLGANSNVYNIAIQADGKIIIGGAFTYYQGIPYNQIVRLGGDPIQSASLLKNFYADSNVVKIYPNPTNGMVTVEMPESVNSSELRVYSVVGVLQKSVMLDKSLSQQVNLESIPEGLYIYEILQNGERKAGGMLKIK
jgi:uncharacterized delta-60 repeat protein